MRPIVLRGLGALLLVVCVGAAPLYAQAHEHDAADLPAFIPRLTDEDRKAAFPDLGGHPIHDPLRYFVLFDQLEWQASDVGSGVNVDASAWYGRARNRLWLRLEGSSDSGRVDEAAVHALFGRQISRWWDLVAGIRQDVDPGPAQTWAAVGLQGLAPYWFQIDATGYVGASGRTQLRGEVEYELLLTNRVVLQPRAEVNVFGKSDPERGIGAGLESTEFGFRLRYELKREVAPYVGVGWRNRWGETADLAEASGESTGGVRLVVGLRFWQ